MKTLFLAPAILMVAFAAQAGDLKIKTSLTGWSFVSESHSVEGTVKKTADGYTCDKATMKIDTLKSGMDLRDDHMVNKYMEAGKFPVATVTNGVAKGDSFTADLELHGVKKPITGKVTGVSDGKITGSFTAKMTDFGMEKANYKGIGVKDEMQVDVTLPIQ